MHQNRMVSESTTKQEIIHTHASHCKSPLVTQAVYQQCPQGSLHTQSALLESHSHNMKVKDELCAGERRLCEVRIKSNAGSLTSVSSKSTDAIVPEHRIKSENSVESYHFTTIH